MNRIISENSAQLNSIFKGHRVSKAFVFGSILNNKFSENSDIDFLINFEDGIEPLERGELWWSLHDNLRALLKREIDLLTESSLKNPYFIEEIKNTKTLLYG